MAGVIFCASLASASDMARKHLYDNLDGVSTLQHKSKYAKVHGIVASLSRIKESTSGSTIYFNGELTDGKTSCRVVGFDMKQQQHLEEFRRRKKPRHLSTAKSEAVNEGPSLKS